MKRYAIWNKEDKIMTPIGEVLTAEQWIERYPIAGVPTVTVVCGAGEINGAFFGTLGQMVQMYEDMGCDFSACTTPEEKLEAIEAFEDEMNSKPAEPDAQTAALEDIAAQLEYQNMMSLEDVESEV